MSSINSMFGSSLTPGIYLLYMHKACYYHCYVASCTTCDVLLPTRSSTSARMKCQHLTTKTTPMFHILFDGRNPAPVDMVDIPLLMRFNIYIRGG